MLCQICKENAATIHLTEINHGQRAETHLCQRCAQQQGLGSQAQIPLNELLSNLLSAAKSIDPSQDNSAGLANPDKTCPVCGMTLRRFSKHSLLGCPEDYTVFKDELKTLVERSHSGHLEHCGKIPSQVGKQQKNDIQLHQLRKQLEQALKAEDYETAAALRDQIRQMQ